MLLLVLLPPSWRSTSESPLSLARGITELPVPPPPRASLGRCSPSSTSENKSGIVFFLRTSKLVISVHFFFLHSSSSASRRPSSRNSIRALSSFLRFCGPIEDQSHHFVPLALISDLHTPAGTNGSREKKQRKRKENEGPMQQQDDAAAAAAAAAAATTAAAAPPPPQPQVVVDAVTRAQAALSDFVFLA